MVINLIKISIITQQEALNKKILNQHLKSNKMKKFDLTKMIGYILITPALISVVLFIIQLITKIDLLNNMHIGGIWTGDSYVVRQGENYATSYGFTSALPFYFGLTGMAGVYLIKDKN